MISNNLKKRIATSIPLIFLLYLSFYYSYILIISLILVTLISYFEFKGLTSKIFKTEIKFSFYKLLLDGLFIIYLVIFSVLIFSSISQDKLKLYTLYLFAVCIFSDIGGLVFGTIFKGRKLTKISPNKTISGSVGSFIMSLVLVPFFYFISKDKFINVYEIIILTALVCFFCQLGDLIISFLKRKAKVKDTSNILPGHGGLLDRIDGILLGLPIGIVILEHCNKIV